MRAQEDLLEEFCVADVKSCDDSKQTLEAELLATIKDSLQPDTDFTALLAADSCMYHNVITNTN